MNENEDVEIQLEYTNDFNPKLFSKGQSKLWNKFQVIIRQESFLESLIKLRKKYRKERSIIDELNLIADVNVLCKKYNLAGDDFHLIIKELALSNKVTLKSIRQSDNVAFYLKIDPAGVFGELDVCSIRDFKKEKEIPNMNVYLNKTESIWPIGIVISPLATQNEIKSFLTKNWKYIEVMQQKYRDSETKKVEFKKRNKAKREIQDFVDLHPDKSIKEIREMLEDIGIFLDDGHISKIRSLEKIRRKKTEKM